ncbi:patatin-like phospholipase family protein [Pseudooceanicola onchidii]|uniref:patatin-like phospholipase family protein n=1 Tax=Pseudooceanicola onchidii TaxID=2562279 RepID=UPI0010AA916C|nr:patatin-like phospholipase family protein [Pseudooceanicola onchidii]
MRTHLKMLALLAALPGCAALNPPLNEVLDSGTNAPLVDMDRVADQSGETWVGLAFSGGGMRASAFAHGMLEEIRAATASAGDPNGLLDDVRLVTGVSGGSVTAAYFGLHGPAGVSRYRDIYLTRNAETYMANSPINPVTIAKGLSGGANGRKTFGRFLDETLFHGATFGDLRKRSRIKTWINASDVANQTTFLFSPETFDALCSDLASFPISDAVAASAAFPLVFSPIVIEAHQKKCDYQEPEWLTSARYNPEASYAMRAHAAALESYAQAKDVKYVKLLDGGITDNFGTTGLAVERARAQVPFAPLTETEAVRMKRLLFLVADAGVQRDNSWTEKLRGPGGVNLAMSIASSAMSAASRTGFDAMRLQLDKWQRDLVDYRCSLSRAQVARMRGTAAGWDCKDLKFFIGLISFRDVPTGMKRRLDDIPTRLKLKTEEVDLAIEAGRIATRGNAEFNGFLVASEIGDTDAPRGRRTPPVGARRIVPVKN